MTRRTLALLLVAGLTMSQPPFSAGQASQTDTDLAIGIRQVREGDFDAALITLDGVVRQLSAQKGQAKELARAYTFLAIAYVGLAQQESAKAKFLEAWKADKSMTLSPKEFPPNIIEFFEQAKKEGQEKASAEANRAPPSKPRQPPATAKGGGSKLPLILLGGAAVVGGGVALAAKGSGEGGGEGGKGCVPSLLSPADGATVDNGCSSRQNPLTLDFAWSACAAATKYHLYVKHPSATFALVDNDGLTGTTYHREDNSYVSDSNRLGWTWRVRAYIGGAWGDWSPERRYDHEPLDTDCS